MTLALLAALVVPLVLVTQALVEQVGDVPALTAKLAEIAPAAAAAVARGRAIRG